MFVVTTKGDYGMRAVIEIARRHGAGEPVQVKEIAARQDVPREYLSTIMVELRRAGIVESVRGRGGGYRLTRPPAEISMGEILEALEGPAHLLECTDDEAVTQCSRSTGCNMRSVWARIEANIAAVLRETTLEQLAGPSAAPVTIAPRRARRRTAPPRGITFHI